VTHRYLNLRHHDADLDGFAAQIADLLLRQSPLLVDVSGHDERCDRIELVVHDLFQGCDAPAS
jgi:hypothetical protein